MHQASHVVLGCTDCHGGNPARGLTKEQAHILPKNKEFWKTSANPPNSSAWLNHESPEFIRFINPGDLRVAKQACGLCHDEIIRNVDHSMMNHGAMLWGAALYNNGGFNLKNYRFGQAYGADGAPLRLINYTPVTPEDTKVRGILPFLDPLPRFNLGNPGNILRIFEKGGEKQLQLGVPTLDEPPGKPIRRLSERGLGTLNRIDPVFLGLQKTRLHDPLLGFLGSNDHAGDYRSSGCSACHVVYANDRSPTNSGWWSKYGHQGLSFTADKTIPKKERGHPVVHQFTRSIPSSQCMNCHMHQGNLFVNPYLGYTWWDQETDGEHMYPKQQRNPTDDELVIETQSNPEAAAAKGLWGDKEFLDKVSELNPKLKNTQFADYHGHGWVFRAIFKHDRKGNLLDLRDNKISHDDPQKFAKAVHLKDVHLAKGMQCTDCHFEKDVHGNGMLYGEPRNATTINCIDCHGTVNQRPTLMTSGNAGAYDLLNTSNTPWGPRFIWEGNKLFQQSVMAPDIRWEVPQTIDTIDPLSAHYNPKSAYAKTLQRDGKTWGGIVSDDPAERRVRLAHDNTADGLPDLPHVMGDELFRLPFADEGKPARAAKQIRGRDGPELHHLQSAGGARRRFHARHRRDGEEEPDGRDPFFERGRGQLAEPESRMGLLPGADIFRGRLQRPGVQPAFRAHDEQCRHDEELHGLPSLEEQRQQCLDDAVARVWHRDGEFLRALRLRR